MKDPQLPQRQINRRDFIKRTTSPGAFTGLMTSGLQAESPNDKLNVAAIGVGGREDTYRFLNSSDKTNPRIRLFTP